MANERQTEAVVRRHFSAYADEITLEEQGSESPRVAKLLRTASKSGRRQGRPDFVVHFRDEPDLLAVVECKALVSKHESPQPGSARGHPSQERTQPGPLAGERRAKGHPSQERTQPGPLAGERRAKGHPSQGRTQAGPLASERSVYADYAVDGALYYASHLKSGFDVLAIAVSGTLKRSRISHFLHLRSQHEAIPIFGDELLSPAEYVKGYRNDNAKYRQDFASLQMLIKELNDTLHIDKVAEGDRALLISAVLIALERPSFQKAYLAEDEPSVLAKMTVEAALESLRGAGVGGRRLDVISQAFGFLTTSAVLTSKPGELKEVINSIDENVNSFRKTHEYRDVLGSLYIEFLRHANSDKGLGIVLTPPHITELFADLARVNTKSVVYDSCAGTGGFLIAAMKKMIAQAKGNAAVERRIKHSQLFGVELQSSIYPLAVSNMFVHQDGKTNVLHGDCFDEDVTRQIRCHKPTIGMLNPPYKADKRRDVEELDFVAANLDCLHPGGRCVAIVPMQSALSQHGRIAECKRHLLSRHTLEAVCSMPNELFFNSKVGVVSCVMVFTAHQPHPKEKKVFLGYFKDDGFEKRKVGGRQDVDGRWEAIRRMWLEHYLNRRTTPGLSVNVALGANDEWVPESYMETDYSALGGGMFENTLHDYATYLFHSRQRHAVSDDRSGPEQLALRDPASWRQFPLTDLFRVSGTDTTPPRDLAYYRRGERPYVTTQATNNGVGGFYSHHTEDGGVLTVDSAVVGYCAYQARGFSASDHVEKLEPLFRMTAPVAMFVVTVLNLEQYRYNYGLKRAQKRLRREMLRLPGTGRGNPDWGYMERYIRGLPYSGNLPPPGAAEVAPDGRRW